MAHSKQTAQRPRSITRARLRAWALRLAPIGTLAIVFGLVVRAPAAPAPDPVGTYLTEDKRARVRVEHCGPSNSLICGYVVWLKVTDDATGHALVDRMNPDPTKQSRPLLGHQLLLGLRRVQEGRFEGQIYNSDNGKTYHVALWRTNRTILHVEGCMLVLLCGSQSWSLVDDLRPGQMRGTTGSRTGPRPDAG